MLRLVGGHLGGDVAKALLVGGAGIVPPLVAAAALQVGSTRRAADQEAAEQAARVNPRRVMSGSPLPLSRFQAKFIVQLGETPLCPRPGLVVNDPQVGPFAVSLLRHGDSDLLFFAFRVADRGRFPPAPLPDVLFVFEHATHLLRMPARFARSV